MSGEQDATDEDSGCPSDQNCVLRQI